MAGRRAFTARDAENIAKKLKARHEDGRRPHTLAIVYYKGIRVTQFGIRRGSKEHGHGHLPGAVFLSQQQTHRLADCPMSYEAWIALMKDKGKIPKDNDEEVTN